VGGGGGFHTLVSIIHAFDPEVIVIGGGVSQKHLDMIMPRITE
jgi:predicted NBD/HSP70 family sugar kinase